MKKTTLILVVLLLLTSTMYGQSFYNADITLSGTHTNNLFKNSYDSTDYLSSIEGSLNLYPVSSGELNLFTKYTNYQNNSFLSNVNYGIGFTLIPLSDSSKYSIYLNMSHKGFKYKEDTHY